MRTSIVIVLVVFSFTLFHTTSALPLDDSNSASEEVVVIEQPEANPEDVQVKDHDIIIDATMQSTAHIEIPESVAKDLLKAMLQAFQHIKASGDVKVSVSVPEEQPAKEVDEPQSR